MIIGTCGFGSSGSSVVTDYLKEYHQFNVIDDFEYTINYCPDGIMQLDYAINVHPSRNDISNIQLERFRRLAIKMSKTSFVKQSSLTKKQFLKLCDEFIARIIQLKWRGYNGTEFIYKSRFYRFFGISILMQRLIPFYERKKNRVWKGKYPYHDINLCCNNAKFVEIAQSFNHSIIEELVSNKKNNNLVVLDQPFPGDDPQSCMKYFRDSKAIVVDRDPRDVYIFLKTKLKNRGSFMPSDCVEDFIKYYKAVRSAGNYGKSLPNVLYLKFEDMVYKYDETTEKLASFLGIGKNPNPKTIFIPSKSMANTQLIERFPEYKNDIEVIEKELSEYLYDFSNCPKPQKDLQMFFGRSNEGDIGDKK